MIIRFCVAAVLLVPTAAIAQGNPGPFGGLFGRAPARTGLEQTVVELRSGLGVQYDTDLLAPEGSVADETQSGLGAGAFTGLILDHMSERLNGSLRGATAREHYFNDSESFGVSRYSADAQLSGKLSDRWEAEAGAAYMHSPHYQVFRHFGHSPDFALDNAFLPFSPYAVEMLENDSVDAHAGVTARITERSGITGSVSHRQTRFEKQPASNFESTAYRAVWNFQLRRDLGVHAGYGRDRTKSLSAPSSIFEHEVVDIGVDFNRSFSVARRTTLGFSTSTSIIKQDGRDQQVRVNGDIVFTKFFRRTWRAAAQAGRSTEFVPGFIEPVFSDFIGASLSGMFSTRLDWLSSVSAGRGQYAFSGTSGVNNATATSRLRVALSKHLDVFGQYLAYWSEIPRGSTTLDLPVRTSRQMVSVGVSAYIPVYKKVRAGQ